MTRVVVGLSGGVDSAVSAYLLQQQGYEVVAGFMKNYVSETGNCTTYDDAKEAINVAKFLGIELLAFDLQKEYNEKVINYIYEGYQRGITPNPDVLCNSLIKFDVFLEKVMELGFDKIATGHYACIKHDAAGYHLHRGSDETKDQSYFLSGLNQFQLSKSLFPIGNITKSEVRNIAKKIGLPNAERKDSQGLCFVGNIPIKTFLEQKLPKQKGEIVDHEGKVIGTHDGAWFFTIGQRHGLNLPPDRYVTSIQVKENIVHVGPRMDEFLNKKEIGFQNRHWVSPTREDFPFKITAKIRYRSQPAPALMYQDRIVFEEEQWAVAPGQVIVAYSGDECLGSGVIE